MPSEKMTLAEAIHLGSLTLKPWAGTFIKTIPLPINLPTSLATATHGCAIGMAMKAVGEYTLLERFPILGNTVKCPCACVGSQPRTLTDAIIHLFDYHIMGINNWTLEHLIEWVASVEKQLTAKVEQPAQEEEEAAEVLV